MAPQAPHLPCLTPLFEEKQLGHPEAPWPHPPSTTGLEKEPCPGLAGLPGEGERAGVGQTPARCTPAPQEALTKGGQLELL